MVKLVLSNLNVNLAARENIKSLDIVTSTDKNVRTFCYFFKVGLFGFFPHIPSKWIIYLIEKKGMNQV